MPLLLMTEFPYIDIYGIVKLVQYLMVGIFITKMKISLTMNSQILSVYQSLTTQDYMDLKIINIQ